MQLFMHTCCAIIKMCIRDSNCTVHQEEWLAGKHGRKSANECVKCGKWEEVCPQHIKIRDELEKVAAELLG